MSDRIDRRLKELAITLPQIQTPWANYVSVVVSGSLVYLSGQLPSLDGVLVKGKLGAELSVDDGRKAARMCALNMLPHLREACGGNLDRVVRCVEIGGFRECNAGLYRAPDGPERGFRISSRSLR